MKALVWTGNDELALMNDLPSPDPADDEVLLRVSHVGICGTDLHIRRGEHPRARPPLVMGHEFSAFVEGGNVPDGLSAGDPVVVYPVIGCGRCDLCHTGREYICGRLGLVGIDRDGGMAEYAVVPSRKVHRLPDGVDMAKAAMIEPVAVGIHTMARCGFREGASVAVVGAGPIGICVGLAAKASGAAKVLISDVSEFRIAVAAEVGLDAFHARDFADAVKDATDGQGAEFVFEATGIPKAAEGVQGLTAIGGTLVIVGVFPEPVPLDLRDVCFRELTILGIRHYTPDEFGRAAEMVASGRIEVGPLISGVFPLDDGIGAFERAARGADVEKVLIRAA